MRASPDRRAAAWLVFVALSLVALLAFPGTGPSLAQPAPATDQAPPGPSFEERFGDLTSQAKTVLETEDTSSQSIEALREQLAQLRGQALDEIRADQTALDEANQRLQALGPAPAEGATEAPELAEHRKSLSDAVAAAHCRLLRSQESAAAIDQLAERLDQEIWRRVSVELRALGPSPLSVPNWVKAYSALGEAGTDIARSATDIARDARERAVVTDTLPRSLAMLVFGVGLTLVLRVRLTRWTEAALERATSARAIAWLVALLNVTRLIVPTIAAVLLFAALDPVLLFGRESVKLFNVPSFMLALIAAGWLASSLFAPRLTQYRLVPLTDAEAARGAQTTYLLGAVMAAHYFVINHLGDPLATPVATSVLHFPLTVVGGWGLWRVAHLYAAIQRNIAKRDALLPPEQRVSALGLGLLAFLERLVWIIGVASPMLAGIGFFAASQTLLYPMILTLGLFGANRVLFDLVTKTARGLVARKGGIASESGLGPVILVALLIVLSTPVLAVIWGARGSDISNLWLLAREGGSLGGIHISLSIIVSFLAVFLLGYAITRATQSVLVSSVLPRTRLDVGGKTAVISGVRYIGYTVAALAAVSATGLDLSNIAIVAGALSVGIGFGLQTIVSNFVSGIILLVERPVKEGDWIEVGGFAGYVRRISVRATEIETFDRASVILPNSDLISGAVLNRTHTGMTGRLQVPVSVVYDSDPVRVSDILLEIASDHPLVLRDPQPTVLLMNLGPDSLDFEIRVWLRDVNFSLSVRSDMNFAIFARLAMEGVRMRLWGRELPPSHEEGDPTPETNPAIFLPPAEEAVVDMADQAPRRR